MKKYILLLVFSAVILPGNSQSGITFRIEDLSRPDEILHMKSYEDVYKNFIMSDTDISRRDIEGNGIKFDAGIIARSKAMDSLVTFGYHSFFNGMYQAYADHRPFVLSPDMIWLLISQGFARHVNAAPEAMKRHFVKFTGKKTLVVTSNDIILNDSNSPWEKIFPEFTKQIAENTNDDIVKLLSADFSTTTPVEKIASEITIMETMKPYFEFIHISIICGIPEITLQGTSEDWRKIADKVEKLSRYDLQWWTNELKPLLAEFVRASQGKINKEFWRNMFKYHTPEKYGAPKIIDGWIVKFFPYDKMGGRNNLQNIIRPIDLLPDEIVKVDLIHLETVNGKVIIETPLELWAGFIGLKQNVETFALTPQIGWMIRKKDVDDVALRQKFQAKRNDPFYSEK